MQLDPKGLEAARTAVADLCNTATEAVPMAHVEATVSAYLSAAPSPSPAPGVVEALRECVTYIRSPLRMTRDEDEEHRRAKIIDRAVSALASLSQPAKGDDDNPGLVGAAKIAAESVASTVAVSIPAKEREGGGL